MTTKRQIIISREDHERLENLFNGNIARDFGDTPNLRSLRGELDAATLISAVEVPVDVVTMNSMARLCDSRSSYEDTYTLVYPEDALVPDSDLSVLAPVGTAILGYRVGDLVQWPVPNGTVQIRIEELVFQPERDGIFM